MIHRLIFYPHECLRKIATEVTHFDKDLHKLLADMKKAMQNKNGLGIAAPQVDNTSRCFLVQQESEVFTFVNPIITKYSEEKGFYEEGCLSVPGVYAEIERPLEVEVKAQDREGKEFRETFDGVMARVIQHELDHLNGVLFFDYLSKGLQNRLINLYNKLQEEENLE